MVPPPCICFLASSLSKYLAAPSPEKEAIRGSAGPPATGDQEKSVEETSQKDAQKLSAKIDSHEFDKNNLKKLNNRNIEQGNSDNIEKDNNDDNNEQSRNDNNIEKGNQESRINKSSSDDEVADSLIGSLAPSLRNINEEGNIEKDQEGIARDSFERGRAQTRVVSNQKGKKSTS
ncbi:uncharacterized protein LOC129899921 [Solanum dulcamara]|uniref:uncharacterized protein LOC129899921 n=1 Tax=Solanum dulcamara TaxID=45834 RepID=UPI002485DE55|nr:uncharacterized protein LOC129899921 [Solanum dulcamara]